MAKTFELICPTILETRLTGFQGAVQKTHRDRVFRVEFHAGQPLRCTKAGVAIAWEKLPAGIRKAAHEGAAILREAMAGEN